METACRYGSKAEAYSSPTAEDVTVKVTLDGEGHTMGRDAELTITLQNSSSEQRTVTLHSQAAVMYYTGVHKATVRKDRTDLDVLPNEGEWLVLGWFSDELVALGVLFYHYPTGVNRGSFIPLAA